MRITIQFYTLLFLVVTISFSNRILIRQTKRYLKKCEQKYYYYYCSLEKFYAFTKLKWIMNKYNKLNNWEKYSIWSYSKLLNYTLILENLWLFEFSEEGDRNRVLEGRPWSYDRTLLIVNEYDGKTPPSQLTFTHSPIWVQVHDMPLNVMNMGVRSKIKASLGHVEEVAVVEDDIGSRRCLGIRVLINLYQPLECGRALLMSGQSNWVAFKYEKLPAFCLRCDKILQVVQPYSPRNRTIRRVF